MSPAVGVLPQPASPDIQADPGSVEDVIARGQRGLRFPSGLEAEFEADTVTARRRLLIICGMVGMLGIWFSVDIIIRLFPDTADLSILARNGLMVLSAASQCVSWSIPRRYWKSQYYEFITTMNTMVVGATILWGATITQVDSMYTHSAAVIGVVMYAGIAARQRFRWTFASCTLTFIGYCLVVEGHTPLQQTIVHSNILMLSMGLMLTLMASYGFEFRERRAWLLRRQSTAIQVNLSRASEQLRELSMRDPLTGLYNRRHFDVEMMLAFDNAAAALQPVAMLMIDVDFFKRYNDSHGHPAGDACLKAVATVLADVARTQEGEAGRLGGEEFGLVLRGYSVDEALAVGRRLCAAVRHAGIAHGASPVGQNVTVSVGVAAVWPHQAQNRGARHALFQMADQALYRAKHEGRDRAAACHHAASPDAENLALEAPLESAADVDANHESDAMLARLSQTLDRGFRWLFFPNGIEAAYQAQHLLERKRHLVMASVLGILAFNVYTYANRGMYPDIASSVLSTVLTLTLMMLVAVASSLLLPMRAWVRESLYALGTTIVAVASVHVLSLSQAFTIFGYAVTLFLVPMFACVVARQPFWFALVPSLATIGCLGLFKPGTPLERLVMEDSAIIVINATLYTLIAAYTLEHGARKEWLLNQIGQRQRQQLEDATRHLHRLTVIDPLTGLCNRRQFEADFARIWSDGAAEGQMVGMLIIDVDFFKQFNDHHGHPAGDRCLKQMASVLTDVAVRERGTVARLGGEEFGILLPGRSLAQAIVAGQKVVSAVRQAGIAHGFSAVSSHVTVSVGVASLAASPGHSARELLSAADRALYEAKGAGRDRVGPADIAAQAASAIAVSASVAAKAV